MARLEAFLDALYEFNQTRNLTRVPREDAWVRHIEDSLAFQDLIPAKAQVLDVGTGPGFPAWPLALARPDLRITAIDSNSKMLSFLLSQPLKNLVAVNRRAEEYGKRERFDVVTGRAVAPLMIQLELSAAPCKIGGIVIPMRSEHERDSIPMEIPALGLACESKVSRPVGEAQRLYPVYRKMSATPREFPRRWADIKANPLHA